MAPAEEAKRHLIYRTRFDDYVKANGTKGSRLCVSAYNDHDHELFTATPAIKRILLQILLAIFATEKLPFHMRDVTKAFVMSKTSLRRPPYLRPPTEMKLEKNTLLKVVKSV